MTSANLSTQHLTLDLDGEVTKVSLKDLQEGNIPPFLRPLSAPHTRPASGMGAYTPFCYEQYAKVGQPLNSSFLNYRSLFVQTYMEGGYGEATMEGDYGG